MGWRGDGLDTPARAQREARVEERRGLPGSAGAMESRNAQGQRGFQRLRQICDERIPGEEWSIDGGGVSVFAHKIQL